MNFLYISPEFPPNFQAFITNMSQIGINVFGIGESDFYDLPQKVRNSLKWYSRTNLNDINAVKEAVYSIFNANPGLEKDSFQIVESHNEYWLELEALLNSEFGIEGFNLNDIGKAKKKSEMKKVFKSLGLEVAKGELIENTLHVTRLADKLEYPVIIKPDIGVGGQGVHKITDLSHLESVLSSIGDEPYIMEEYIEGGIQTYDGLTDYNGNVIYESSLVLSDGILDYINGRDISFYTTREIPEPLRDAGQKMTKAFGIKRKFFHFEFFRKGDSFIPIEINARPPGGNIIDMMNYSFDSDLYYHYASMIKNRNIEIPGGKKYYCIYLSRKGQNYKYSHQHILSTYGSYLISYEENLPLYWRAMGRFRYLFRAKELSKIKEIERITLEIEK